VTLLFKKILGQFVKIAVNSDYNFDPRGVLIGVIKFARQNSFKRQFFVPDISDVLP
jgi:hypothetical protein